MRRGNRWFGPVVAAAWIHAGASLGQASSAPANGGPAPAPDATISSDELEMRDNGAASIFKGHVVLTQQPYVLHADRMVQTKATQLVEAFGHIRATSVSPSGEHYLATGERASYDPTQKLTELWQDARVVRWETAADTSPIVAVAEHFTASDLNHTIEAHGRVRIEQGKTFVVESDEAKYVEAEKVIYFWGLSPVSVHYQGPKQLANFHGRKGQVYLSPKRARLIDQVQGRVIPL
ncbi:MAG TPA: LptA/OstA family protein [Verrucomicrobiae bacterium]|nr:LptA/OstA family protein [Verrucomicrobiae bacterium]